MNFKRLLHTEFGKICVSIILGLGLATLFRKVCKDKDCIVFNGPVISEIDQKVFKHGNGCYQYDIESTPCDKTKQIVDISKKKDDEFNPFPPPPKVDTTEKKGLFGLW